LFFNGQILKKHKYKVNFNGFLNQRLNHKKQLGKFEVFNYNLTMKTIFLGTPEFAIPSLEVLLKTPWIELLAVCTQTDKEAGRGKQIKSPPVKDFALKNNIQIIQAQKIAKENDAITKLKSLNPDILISCSFGQILNEDILNIAPLGAINVHASLLPKYRGAAPINWAILNGDNETGITIMKTVLSLDAGPTIYQEKCEIGENETSTELYKRLSILGAKTLIKTLELIKSGKAKFVPQEESKATKSPSLKKEMGLIDWNNNAKDIHNKIRGLQPWPSAYTHFNGKTIKIWESRIEKSMLSENEKFEPGTIIEITDCIKVKTKDSHINIYKLQPENKNIINAKDWINGARVKIGDRFD